jgi:hypothetical protein
VKWERLAHRWRFGGICHFVWVNSVVFYGQVCGKTLARAHARSGDPVELAAYMGMKDQFDQSIVDFAERYADQKERDYQAFTNAVRTGRLPALEGL